MPMLQQQPLRKRPPIPQVGAGAQRTLAPVSPTAPAPARSQSTYLDSFNNANPGAPPVPGVPQSGGPGGADHGGFGGPPGTLPGLAKAQQGGQNGLSTALPPPPVNSMATPGMASMAAPGMASLQVDQTPAANPATGITPTLTTAPGSGNPGMAPLPTATSTPVASSAAAPIDFQIHAPGSSPLKPVGGMAPGVTPPPLANPNVAGANVTPIAAGDLRSGLITPGTSARGTAAAKLTDAAATKAAGFDYPKAIGTYADEYGADLKPTDVKLGEYDPNVAFNGVDTDLTAGDAINPNDSPELAAFKQQRMAAANKVGTGPTRGEIAQQNLDAFDTTAAPQLRDQLRSVGQQAAARGRIGMGETAIESLRPYTDYLSQRKALETRLAADSATGEIADRQNNLAAASGLVGQEAGLGANTRAEQRGERSYATGIQDTNIGRAIGERNTALDVATGNVNRTGANREFETGVQEGNVSREYDAKKSALEMAAGVAGNEGATNLSTLNAFGNAEGNVNADEAAKRNELRTERDTENDQAALATQQGIQGHQLESADQSDEYNRMLQAKALELGVDPSALFLGASNQFGKSAAGSMGGASDIIAQILARRKPAGG